MKVIKKDNYDRENVSDVLVCENCPDAYAERIADLLNRDEAWNTSDFFKAVPDDYELYRYEP